MVKFAFVASALLVAAVPAAAQDPAPTAVPQSNGEKTDVNKVVCQKEESIGCRVATKKVCLSVKQWQERARADREETERIQQQSAVRTSG
jgi:hypothetical protein